MLEQVTAWLAAHPLASQFVVLSALLVGALVADIVARRVLVRLVHQATTRTTGEWDDALAERKVFARLAHLAPTIVIYFGLDFAELNADLSEVLRRITGAAMLVVALRAFSATLNAVNDVYARSPEARTRPIKGYLQIIALIAWLLGTIVVIATVLGRSPVAFLTGIGALSAVLLLIFRDTLLSLVASVQLTSNDMVGVGDWIEVPKHGADGEVVDIALHTVKVQNWDKTTTSVPTYELIAHGFKNWRSMGESGGRRIRRSLLIDAQSVRHLTDDEIHTFGRYELLADYIRDKQAELAASNESGQGGEDRISEHRRLTNIGTWRAYIERYLVAHGSIRDDMTVLVRQLDSTPQGVPIQIYCFTNTTDWNAYEAIQSDIFDHLFAVIHQFSLEIYQEPSGADLRRVLKA